LPVYAVLEAEPAHVNTQVLTVAAVLLMCGCAGTAAERSSATPAPAFNSGASPAGDCWARLYEHKNFGGRALTIPGPARIAELPPHWGFPWDPRYGSLAVGPAAVLSLFDDPDLHDRRAIFKAGAAVSDLDREMGLFRRIRSARVACR
jgi:hypothetical protein